MYGIWAHSDILFQITRTKIKFSIVASYFRIESAVLMQVYIWIAWTFTSLEIEALSESNCLDRKHLNFMLKYRSSLPATHFPCRTPQSSHFCLEADCSHDGMQDMSFTGMNYHSLLENISNRNPNIYIALTSNSLSSYNSSRSWKKQSMLYPIATTLTASATHARSRLKGKLCKSHTTIMVSTHFIMGRKITPSPASQ